MLLITAPIRFEVHGMTPAGSHDAAALHACPLAWRARFSAFCRGEGSAI